MDFVSSLLHVIKRHIMAVVPHTGEKKFDHLVQMVPPDLSTINAPSPWSLESWSSPQSSKAGVRGKPQICEASEAVLLMTSSQASSHAIALQHVCFIYFLKGERAKLLLSKNLITTDFVDIKLRGILSLNTDINQNPEITFGRHEKCSSNQSWRQKAI